MFLEKNADEAEEEANSAVGVEGEELAKIYLRMVSEWMIAGWSGVVKVCNGVFGVYKEFAPNWNIRLIIDARKCNSRLVDSPYVPLVTPAGLAASLRQMLRTRPKPRSTRQELWTGKRDVSCCFYVSRLLASMEAVWVPCQPSY